MWNLVVLVLAVAAACTFVVIRTRSTRVALAAFTVALLVGFLTPPIGEVIDAGRPVTVTLDAAP